MSFTQSQYDALCSAIAEGALIVKYADKQVEYRSLDEMLKIKAMMAADLLPSTNTTGSRRIVGVYGSGL